MISFFGVSCIKVAGCGLIKIVLYTTPITRREFVVISRPVNTSPPYVRMRRQTQTNYSDVEISSSYTRQMNITQDTHTQTAYQKEEMTYEQSMGKRHK